MFNELFLQIDFIPNLLYFTNADPYEDLLIEMTWILTNITSSDSEDVINTLDNIIRGIILWLGWKFFLKVINPLLIILDFY